jgi:hypothetical protein
MKPVGLHLSRSSHLAVKKYFMEFTARMGHGIAMRLMRAFLGLVVAIIDAVGQWRFVVRVGCSRVAQYF